MQVFLPYPDLKQSVCCLDNRRLGNQVYRECITLLRGKWSNHPVSKMWQPYFGVLVEYALIGVDELARRGKVYYGHDWYLELADMQAESFGLPTWFGDDRLHSSHRAALLYKNFAWYSRFGWNEQPAIPDSKGRLPYYWP